MSYLLIHRSPSGQIAAHGAVFDEAEDAARTATLYLPGELDTVNMFVDDFALKLTGAVAEHPDGYSFRVVRADFTSDGIPITPDLKVYISNEWWGTVAAEQFMVTDLFSPGSRFHDGWYLVCKSGAPHAKYNGERMQTTS